MSAGVWLERDLDWLAMGSGWKTGLFGERSRGRRTCWGALAPCSQDRVGLAGHSGDSYRFLALRLKHSGGKSQHFLVSLPWSFEVEMVWVRKQPCHSGSLPCTPHQGPQACTFRDRCLRLPALRACQSIRAGRGSLSHYRHRKL